MDEAERLEPVSSEAWSQWLAGHHDEARGVWLISRRRAADRVFSYEQGVLEAAGLMEPAGWESAQASTYLFPASCWWTVRRRNR